MPSSSWSAHGATTGPALLQQAALACRHQNFNGGRRTTRIGLRLALGCRRQRRHPHLHIEGFLRRKSHHTPHCCIRIHRLLGILLLQETAANRRWANKPTKEGWNTLGKRSPLHLRVVLQLRLSCGHQAVGACHVVGVHGIAVNLRDAVY